MAIIDANGTELYVEDDGPRDRPAIVCSHSLFLSGDMWAQQVEAFAGRYRMVRYDHRGQARSASAPAEQLDMDTLAADAAELIETLGVAPCHFIGNSMGGFVALRLAARHPELLRSCTVLGSSGEDEYRVDEFGPIVTALQEHGAAPLLDTLMYIMFGDTFLADPAREAERSRWRDWIRGLGPAIGDAAHGVVYRKGVLQELAGCDVPILALAGAEDHAYDASLSEHVAETAPRGRCIVIPAAGHSVALEQPTVVNDHLAAHFSAAD